MSTWDIKNPLRQTLGWHGIWFPLRELLKLSKEHLQRDMFYGHCWALVQNANKFSQTFPHHLLAFYSPKLSQEQRSQVEFFLKQQKREFFFSVFNSFSLQCYENEVFLKIGPGFSNSPLCYHPEFDSISCLNCNSNRDPGKYYDFE